ncbi:hypothetical protein Ct61P_11178 [Colletotrichum tofieldiae]|nr:hypothetical protein Ct61P_11178 [Colletotrichum tofieldiae]
MEQCQPPGNPRNTGGVTSHKGLNPAVPGWNLSDSFPGTDGEGPDQDNAFYGAHAVIKPWGRGA